MSIVRFPPASQYITWGNLLGDASIRSFPELTPILRLSLL